MFQIKSFLSIVASMLNHVRSVTTKITDFNVGGVVRTMLEAVATEINELYQQMVNGLIQAIPVSVFKSFNFPALGANAATGAIQVKITAQTGTVTIQSGTIFTYGGNSYTNTAAVVIPAGSTQVLVPVGCTVAGVAGNVPAGKTFSLNVAPAGFISATNPAAIQGGTAQETNAAQQLRFQQYIASIARSNNAGMYYGVDTCKLLSSTGTVTEQVATCAIIEPYSTDPTQPPALVNIYIHNGVGGTSLTLLNLVQKTIDGYLAANGTPVPGYKAAGVHCSYYIATEQLLPVMGVITAAEGYESADLLPGAIATVYAYILASGIGGTVEFAEIEDLVMNIPGISNFVISTPMTDTVAGPAVKLMPGTINITASN